MAKKEDTKKKETKAVKRVQAYSFAFEAYVESSKINDIVLAIGDFVRSHYLTKRLDSKHYEGYWILHDKDIWTEEDEKENSEHKAGHFKKPHWHIMVKFDFRADKNKFTKFMTAYCGIKHIETCNYRAYKVYLSHVNEIGKHKYDFNEVHAFGHAEPYTIEGLQEEQKNTYEEVVLGERLMEIIKDTGCTNSFELLLYVNQTYDLPLLKYLKDNKSFINNYFSQMSRFKAGHFKMAKNSIRELQDYELEKKLEQLKDDELQRDYYQMLWREYTRRCENKLRSDDEEIF